MSLAGEIVDAVLAVGRGIAEWTDADRKTAKLAVREQIAQAKEHDLRELLGARADAITAAHLDRVRKIAERHGLDADTVSVLSPPPLPLTSIPTESGIDLRRIIRGGPLTADDLPVLPDEDEGG